MLNIKKSVNGSSLTVTLEGKLTTSAAQQLDGELKQELNGITELVFDLEKLEYITSAGLRMLLSCQKVMNRQGEMRLRRVNPQAYKILNMTGFLRMFVLED